MQDYITKLHFTCPRFVALRHPTLQNKLVRSHLTLTDEQLLDVTLSIDSSNHQEHTTTAKLPQLHPQSAGISPCKHPRCCTCNVHLNCSYTFTSNHPYNRTIYQIRHSFSCNSANIVYLITCTKCKKQYVRYTTQKLKVRINHHRTSINSRIPTYIHKHFNLPDHSITNLKVQPIDRPCTPQPSPTELQHLESFWIKTLRSLTPYGLNSLS